MAIGKLPFIRGHACALMLNTILIKVANINLDMSMKTMGAKTGFPARRTSQELRD